MMARVSQAQVRAVRAAVNAPAFLFKIGRFSPDKRWHQAIAAVGQLKERGAATRMLMRGGLEPFGGEVLDFAAQSGLRGARLATPIEDVAGPGRALRGHARAAG